MSSEKLTQARIVGSGLIGTSIGLGLVQAGVAVEMIDSDTKAQSLANDLVGGVEVTAPELVVLAMPTSQLSVVIQSEFALNPHSTFIDVGSVKGEVELKVKTISALSTRFLPTHPMAGREIGGTGMFVDHRTYDFHPGKMAGWLEAYEKYGLPVQKRMLGQLLLFAVTEIGPINQVVFMWAYESLGDRDRRRTAMMSDPGWAEFGKAIAPLGALKQQTVMEMKPTSFSPVK